MSTQSADIYAGTYRKRYSMPKNYESDKRCGHQSIRAHTDKQEASLASSMKRWDFWLIEPGAPQLCAGRRLLDREHLYRANMINMYPQVHKASSAWIWPSHGLLDDGSCRTASAYRTFHL
jgi:hypothetical protein